MAHGSECEEKGEKLHHKKLQIFSRGLTLSHFSKSFVTLQTSFTRIAHLSPLSHHHHHSHSHSQSAPSSPICGSPRSADTSSCSTPTSVSSVSSSASHGSSTPSTPNVRSHQQAKRPTCVTFGKRHSKRSKSVGAGPGDRRPVILDKIPSGKSGEQYITIYVGIKRTQRVKYVISRDILSHHLFQVLLKCSEDEFGQEYTHKGGIAIICDPALFLQVVKVVDGTMKESCGKSSQSKEDEGSSYDSDES